MAVFARRSVRILALMLSLAPVIPVSAGEPDENASDGCGSELPAGSSGLDAMRAGLQHSVCSTARFVDRLFGGEHEYTELEDETNGRAGFGLDWNEQDGAELDGRFRASLSLPAINERFNVTVGRAGRDEFVADEVTRIGPVGGSFFDDQPADWFAGLGYNVRRGRANRFDLGAGIELGTPVNPYLNAHYRRYLYPRDDILLTLLSTAFWENRDGFGLTQGFDADRVVARDYLLRWANSVRWSEETLGIRWRSRLALYQTIDQRRAMRYELTVRGETDGTEPDRYGMRVTHRRSIWQRWFFIEAGADIFWADGPLPADRCDACLGASLGFEILFGKAYDRALRREAREVKAAGDSR